MYDQSRVITKKKHPEIYEWLLENIHNYIKNRDCYTLTEDEKINAYCDVIIKYHKKEFKHPFAYIQGDLHCVNCQFSTSLKCFPEEVGGNFICSDCENLISIIGAPKKVGGGCRISNCYSLTSFIGLPKYVKSIFNIYDNQFSNNPEFKKKYNLYIDMWLELFESVSDKEKIEYLNNYKEKIDYMRFLPIIPKEIINQYKIDFLLNGK